jgi:hypothetical protein
VRLANTFGGRCLTGVQASGRKMKRLADPAADRERDPRRRSKERFSPAPRVQVKYRRPAEPCDGQGAAHPDAWRTGRTCPTALDDNSAFYVRRGRYEPPAADEIVALVREAFGLEREAEPEEGDLAIAALRRR